MARTKGGVPKDPAKYMKFREEMIKRHGQTVFASMNIPLPDEFQVLSDYEKESLNNRVSDQLYTMNKDLRSVNEDAIASEGLDDFVSNEDWEKLNSDTPMESSVHHFKMFTGKNYSLEFARIDEQIHFHLYYPAPTIVPREDVFEMLELLMTPVIPRHWRVSMKLETKVTPHNSKRNSDRKGDYPTSSSYGIHFIDAATLPNSKHYLEKALRVILQKFIMPDHNMGGA